MAEDRAGFGKPLVQTQALGLLDIPVNPVFSKRFSTPLVTISFNHVLQQAALTTLFFL